LEFKEKPPKPFIKWVGGKRQRRLSAIHANQGFPAQAISKDTSLLGSLLKRRKFGPFLRHGLEIGGVTQMTRFSTFPQLIA